MSGKSGYETAKRLGLESQDFRTATRVAFRQNLRDERPDEYERLINRAHANGAAAMGPSITSVSVWKAIERARGRKRTTRERIALALASSETTERRTPRLDQLPSWPADFPRHSMEDLELWTAGLAAGRLPYLFSYPPKELPIK